MKFIYCVMICSSFVVDILIAKNIVKPFYVKTEITNNYYTSEKNSSRSFNKLEIIDTRTNLNGLKIYSEKPLSNIKIKIDSCVDNNEDNRKIKRISDCFLMVNSSIFNKRKVYLVVLPKEIFKNIEEYNFKDNDMEGGVFIMSCKEFSCIENYIFYKGIFSVRKNNKFNIITSESFDYWETMYNFDGYYYIGYDDIKEKRKRVDKIEKAKGKHIGSQEFYGLTYSYYTKNGHVYLENFLLEGIDSNNFTFFGKKFSGYYKDKNNLYSVQYDFECGHHHCWLEGIKDIKIIEKNDLDLKSFVVLDNECELARDNKYLYKIQKNRSPAKKKGLIILADINPNEFICNGRFIFDSDGDAIYWDYNGDIRLHKTHIDFDTMIIFNRIYTKDKKHVYVEGKTIVNADSLTFEIINDNNFYDAKDKNNFYQYGKIVSDTSY